MDENTDFECKRGFCTYEMLRRCTFAQVLRIIQTKWQNDDSAVKFTSESYAETHTASLPTNWLTIISRRSAFE